MTDLSRVHQVIENCRHVGANPAEVQGSVPFPDAGNPLMAQLAFLTTMLSPGIAAAAAQRALEVRACPSVFELYQHVLTFWTHQRGRRVG